MPVWIDVLLNIIGYAGFIGVATLNHSPEQAAETRGENVN